MKVIPRADLVAPRLAEFAAASGRGASRVPTPVRATRLRSTRTSARGARFDEALGEFAAGYAEQTARDHAQLVDAIARGEVAAESG